MALGDIGPCQSHLRGRMKLVAHQHLLVLMVNGLRAPLDRYCFEFFKKSCFEHLFNNSSWSVG